MSLIKKRNWAFVAYPESLPNDWLDILTISGLQVAISPLHDKDLNPTGELKKPHYHIIVIYNGPTSYNVVKRLTDSINATIPIPLEAVKGYYRYLTHKDNPEKYQYDELDISCLNGFAIDNYCELTNSEVNKIILELSNIIRDNLIYEYSDLINFLIDNQLNTYFNVASSHTLYFSKYIESFRCKNKK